MNKKFLSKNDKIFLTGHNGLVGSSLFSKLHEKGYKKILTVNRNKLDLRNTNLVNKFLKKNKPSIIIIAAAKVGGIMANSNSPVDFLNDNIMIQSNLINLGFKNRISKIIFLGSSCIYPKFAKQPLKEEYLLDGQLETTNEAYALAKIVGVKLCNYYNSKFNMSYRCLMPTNLFGENDNYDVLNGHVIPALIKKIFIAKKFNKSLKVWGDGSSKREFLHVDDLSDACIFCMKLSDKKFFNSDKFLTSHINVGSGEMISIKKLVKKITKIMNFKNKIIYDNNFPNGTPIKYLDSTKINSLGWKSKISLDLGLKNTVENYLEKNY